jgi:hypothetical protein
MGIPPGIIKFSDPQDGLMPIMLQFYECDNPPVQVIPSPERERRARNRLR